MRLVEKLRKGCIEWRCEDRDVMCNEAADRIEKLEAALNFYANHHANPNEGPWGVSSDDFGDVARKALDSE